MMGTFTSYEDDQHWLWRVGERSVCVVVASCLDDICELDRVQNGPDAPLRQPVNPPPGGWGRQRDLASLPEVASVARLGIKRRGCLCECEAAGTTAMRPRPGWQRL